MPSYSGPAPDLGDLVLPGTAEARYAPAATGNFRPIVGTGSGRNIKAIALHTTEGSFASGINWGQNPAAGTSYH